MSHDHITTRSTAKPGPQPPERLPDLLPDFHNLGVILRILAGLNVVFLLGILANPVIGNLSSTALQTAAWFEPLLLGCVGLLALLQRGLQPLPYWRAHWIVVGLCGGASWLGARQLDRLIPDLIPLDNLRLSILAMACAIGTLGYFRLRGRALSPLLAEARLQALTARIRPHFLFNSMNAILSLIRKDPRRAETALENLADLIRVLMADNRSLSTLQRELELARHYLELEGLRLGERLRVDWFTENMPDNALIPPLILQPLLENAVYHGIEPAIEPGVIQVTVFQIRRELHIDIRNPCLPVRTPRQGGNGMALENIRERLMLHFDAEASLTTTVSRQTYQVHIVMPLREVA